MSVKQLIAGKHSCVGHLSAEGGLVENKARLEKPAVLVYCGKFSSMDGDVEITEEHIDRLVANHNERLSKLMHLALPVESMERRMPPLQLDHSTSARDTVGRVIGKLSKGRHILEDGTNVAALMADKILVLGSENVEKVMDGRWSNLSIGADLEAGTLNELSITPFPAAANASLLKAADDLKRLNDFEQYSKGSYKGFSYEIETDDNKYYGYVDQVEFDGVDPKAVLEMIKKYVDEKPTAKLSEGEPMEHDKVESKEEIKARHLAEKEALSASHTEELKSHKLEEVKVKHEDQMRSLQEKHAEELKKLGVDPEKKEEEKLSEVEEEEKEKKMSANRAKIITLAKGMRTGLKTSRMAAREQTVVARIARLRSMAKMTPAEQKKVSVAELAAKTDAEVESFFKGYEIRENVIDPRVHGTTKAINLSKLSKDARLARLEAETRKDMGMPMTDDQRKALAEDSQVPGAERLNDGQGQVPHEEMLKHLESMMGEHPNKEAVMSHVKKMLGMDVAPAMSADHAESVEKQMSAIAENFNRLQTEFQDFIALVGETAGIKSAELTE